MRKSVKSFSQAVCLLSLGLVSTVVFQNCGSYQPNTDLSTMTLGSNIAAVDCNGPASCTVGADSLYMRIGGPGVIGIQQPPNGIMPAVCDGNNSRCFDVAGWCETADFLGSVFSIELDGPTGFAETPTTVTCDSNGRFRIEVQLPTGYNYGAIHNLIVRMYGVDSHGQTVSNPRMTNQQSISIVSYQ